jgi:hypothetical protein
LIDNKKDKKMNFVKLIIVSVIAFLFGAISLNAQTYYPQSIKSFNQGFTNGGTPVLSNRSDPSKALGSITDSDIETGMPNFVSLGFGGTIILDFGQLIPVDPNTGIRVIETTFGYRCTSYPETGNVLASKDGIDYVYINQTCGNEGNVMSPYPLIDSIRYIQIVDVSPISRFIAFIGADAYDLDGVEISNLSPLPIVLGEFEMTYLEELISIYIKTLSEANSLRFHIEASEDLVKFRLITSIYAYGNSNTERDYEKTVEFQPLNEVTYFRLSEEDLNGRIVYHELLPVITPTKPTEILFHYDILGRRTNEQSGIYVKILMRP